MIISRKEFYRRMSMGSDIKVIKEKKELMSVERLFKEIQADAPFRNHSYLFKKTDLSKLELQEETVGIKKKFPKIKTEGERLEKIKEELINDTYEPVTVHRDIDYPDVIYVRDGFHRVFGAQQLGFKAIRVLSKYGKFVLTDAINLKQLAKLLNMVEELFCSSKDYELTTVKQVRKFLDLLVKKNPERAEMHTIGYGSYKEALR